MNRATSIVGEAYGARYVYRADGMRVEKVEGLTISWVPPGEEEVSGHYDDNLAQNLPTSRYYYDGQMMVEDDYTVEGQNEPVVTVMRYGIGARGIDFLAKSVDGGAETVGFPLYDGHGNMIATLGQTQNSPYYGLSDLRTYDVWGSVRSGSTSGDPKQRYCANLGHVQDAESGLIYMRARYYEPWSGRFISEDPDRADVTAFAYARNSPTTCVDLTGLGPQEEIAASLLAAWDLLTKSQNLETLAIVEKYIIARLQAIVEGQTIRAGEQFALADAARASGSAAAARWFQSLGAKSLAYAVSAKLAIYTVRCMVAIVRQILEMEFL